MQGGSRLEGLAEDDEAVVNQHQAERQGGADGGLASMGADAEGDADHGEGEAGEGEGHLPVQLHQRGRGVDPPAPHVEDFLAQLDEALTKLASNQQSYTDAPKTKKAAIGDQLIIDFVGRVDGEEFQGGKAEGAALVLGSGQFIPGFEDQLTGVKTSPNR